MLAEILAGIGEVFSLLFRMFGLGGGSLEGGIPPNTLRVFIRHQGGTGTFPFDLNPASSIREVKEVIAPKLGLRPQEIKIIFAGKELPDDLILQACDVGQQSFLHAVRVQVRSPSESASGSEGAVDNGLSSALNLDQKEVPAEAEAASPISSIIRHSEYYVYCNTCEAHTEGKLRVRCSLCLSGAFTVLRDPEGWDDVLKPNQVPGSCETPDCPGSFSQFYFKCGSHVTKGEDDSAPPLPQVKRNPDSVPCLACGDPKEPVLLFQCPSTHVTCIDCFQQYTLLKLNERQFVQDPILGYTVGCPALCPDSLVEDAHHFKLMGKYQYDRYQRFGAEECVLQAGGVLCPQPNCGMGIIPTDTRCNKVACVHGCEFVFCRLCLEGWHMGDCTRGESGQQAAASSSSTSYPIESGRAAVAKWEDASRRALRLSTKPCPKCRVATERAGGCMHMECPKCGFQWCWVCQVDWSRDCMGNHWFG